MNPDENMALEPDAEKMEWLLAIVQGEIEEPVDLGDEDKSVLVQLRKTLLFIDESWQLEPKQSERLHARFLQEIAAEEPNHPWAAKARISTLGELARAGVEDLPSLPDPVFKALLDDTTPLADLTDRSTRPRVAARIAQKDQLPVQVLGDFLNWLNSCMAQIAPTSSGRQYIFTRRSSLRQRKQVVERDQTSGPEVTSE